jgi:hypothetical protein
MIQFLIWSNEHSGWWAPGNRGYTKNRKEAARYALSDALKICEKANRYIRGDTPNELLVQDWGVGTFSHQQGGEDEPPPEAA